MAGPEQVHWLARPGTIRLLWAIFIVVLAGLVALDLLVTHHPNFSLDSSFGFGAWFGFLSCVALIVFAKALGAILKRPDTYYDS
jgi:hypothetical protein